ncbi:leucine-rich repeat domain-containing protein [Paenibacillus chartarius]|uniref:Leucine-rich repeat domain-containing protein n=1 Tax=Paenibacillus chartarius TaxID=747481 RepID=A0ABV6DVM4_9BACL
MIKKIVVSTVLAFAVVAFGSSAYAAEGNHPSALGSDVVTIPDTKLESAVRTVLNKPTGSISVTDMEQLTALNGNYRHITNLQGLEYAKNLKSLELKFNEITDFTPISNLTSLEKLDIGFNKNLTVFPSLPKLGNLSQLDFEGSQISDISNLKDLPNLSYLSISDNPISDFSPISRLSKLKTLMASNVKMTDLSPIAGATSLENLYLRSTPYGNNMNQISDLSPLKSLKNLSILDVSFNNVSDLSIIEHLPRISRMNLEYNQITDVTLVYNLFLNGRLPNVNIIITDNPLKVYAGSKTLKQLQYLTEHGLKIEYLSFSKSTSPAASDITIYNQPGISYAVIKNVRKDIQRIWVSTEISPNYPVDLGYADVNPDATVIHIPLDFSVALKPEGGTVYVTVKDYIKKHSDPVYISYGPVTTTDKLPPVTKYQVQPVYETSSKGERYISALTVTLTASDSSGIQSTMYRINGGIWTSYTEPFTILAKDALKVEYMSTDSNGNTEDINVMDFEHGTFIGSGKVN